MTQSGFTEIAAWRYEAPYDFYDGDADPVLDPERYFAVRAGDGDPLAGFYYFEEKGNGVVEIGLGLRPDLTGAGLGLAFFREGLAFGRRRFSARKFILNVAAFNERAIAVYERGGFRETGRHVRSFERFGDVEFVEMEER
jgi:aminoglycoside 6'-N-acetyltransferase/ribosomal-protein-alanine N-acetyltransferase